MATVLVADDSVLYLRLAELILTRAGHRVLLAHDGREALEVARAAHPDVIFCDVVMPGLDGPAAVREMRAEPALRDTPVYLLTGAEPQERLAFSETTTAAGTLTKPFSAEDLLAAVRRHAPS